MSVHFESLGVAIITVSFILVITYRVCLLFSCTVIYLIKVLCSTAVRSLTGSILHFNLKQPSLCLKTQSSVLYNKIFEKSYDIGWFASVIH